MSRAPSCSTPIKLVSADGRVSFHEEEGGWEGGCFPHKIGMLRWICWVASGVIHSAGARPSLPAPPSSSSYLQLSPFILAALPTRQQCNNGAPGRAYICWNDLSNPSSKYPTLVNFYRPLNVKYRKIIEISALIYLSVSVLNIGILKKNFQIGFITLIKDS